MSSTHEAFSLPPTSPTVHTDASRMLEPDSAATSPSYSYPPSNTNDTYSYIPASTRSRQSTLLPLHFSPSSPLSPRLPYPPLSHTWQRLRTWLAREYPELGDTLNWGILPDDLAQIEMQFGFALPAPVRESYLTTDGQEPESSAGCSDGLFFGLTLLTLEDVLDEWRFWREVDEDPATGANVRLRDLMQSVPPSWVRREYSLRGWIPLVTDKGGNYIGIDMNPANGGTPGQVIIFGRDFDTKVVLWKGDGVAGWAKWLASFADELESGEGFELGMNEGSDDSEDDLGYESYFYDGSGRGSGDGGGESGPGGMRLTGMYKGWSTLEALADRSIRKWHQEGFISDMHAVSDNGKYSDKMPLAAFELSAAGHGSAAEVPIPVMAQDVEGNDATTPVQNKTAIPTISVTRPPIPLTVDIPTEQKLIAVANSYPNETDDDVEAGRGVTMQQIDLESRSVSVNPRTPTPLVKVAEYTEDAVLVALPEDLSHSPTPASHQDIDLLTNDEIMMVMHSPVSQQSSSRKSGRPTTPDTKPEPVADETQDQDPDRTIRLVGGGGIQGMIDDGQEKVEDSDSDLFDVQSVSSIASTDSVAKKALNHVKKSSIASGLKKLGKLGAGKRKTDPTTSSGPGMV